MFFQVFFWHTAKDLPRARQKAPGKKLFTGALVAEWDCRGCPSTYPLPIVKRAFAIYSCHTANNMSMYIVLYFTMIQVDMRPRHNGRMLYFTMTQVDIFVFLLYIYSDLVILWRSLNT